MNMDIITYNYCNLDYLNRHSPNNASFLKEILTMFIEHTPVYIDEMNRFENESNWEGIRTTIHKLRPTIDIVGMPSDISASAKQIEEYCLAKSNLELVPDLLLKVKQAFRLSCAELTNELERLNQKNRVRN